MLEAPAPIQLLSDKGSSYIAEDTRALPGSSAWCLPLTTPVESRSPTEWRRRL